jgi:hypothetical protein
MTSEDPFEAEQARRNRALEQDEKERLMALIEDELPVDRIGDGLTKSGKTWMSLYGVGATSRLDIIHLALATEANNEAVRQQEQARWDAAMRPLPADLKGAYERIVHEQQARIDEEQKEREEEEEQNRLFPRIGGWQAGNSHQDLQSARFEIEAERALFLGKPAPTQDEKLAALHKSLSDLHLAYQKSGDASLLLGIADMTTKYQTALAKHQKRKNGGR